MGWAIRATLALLVLALLASSWSAQGLADAQVVAEVGLDHVVVRVELTGLNSSLFEVLVAHPEALNESTIPDAMAKAAGEGVFYLDPSLSFDNATRSLRASFTLAGSGLLSFSFNRTNVARIYKLKTGWRKTDVEVRLNETWAIRLNFSSFFRKPLARWEHLDRYELGPGDVREALLLNTTVEDALFENATGRATWVFVLPRGARFLRAVREGAEELLVFEMPPDPWDMFAASPFWPFLMVIVAVGIAVAYRRASVRLVKPGKEAAGEGEES